MENVHIIIDVSSSMAVLSKQSILQNIYSFIQNITQDKEYKDFAFIYYIWQDKAILPYYNDNINDINFDSSADMKGIVDFIKESNGNVKRILLLTDGYINHISNFPCVIPKDLSIDIVNVGIDCNSRLLSDKLKANIFQAEDIFNAIMHICFQV